MVRYWVWGALCILSAAVLGCGQSTLDPSALDTAAGVTETEIRIGSSLALGGHAGYLGTQMLQGAMSYIRAVNDNG